MPPNPQQQTPTVVLRVPSQQETLVLSHLRLADSIARGFARSRAEWRDLQQVAYLGLVKAANRFNPSLSTKFAAYAVPTVQGEIKRFLRDSSWMVRPPRPIQELHLRVHSTVPHLTQTLRRDPSSADLARALGDQPHNIDAALLAGNNMRPTSLDGAAREEPATRKLTAAIADTDRGFEEVEQDILIRQLCQHLTESECQILHLRYFDEFSQQQITDQLGMTQIQVSRQLRKVLNKLWDEFQRSDTSTDDDLPEAS